MIHHYARVCPRRTAIFLGLGLIVCHFLRTTGEYAFGMNRRGSPRPSAWMTQVLVEAGASVPAGNEYSTWPSSSHSAWSSTLRFSESGHSSRVLSSSTERRQVTGPTPPPSRFLKARRVLSGDSEGHSTFSRRTRASRAVRSPSIRYVRPPVRSVA